MDILEANPRVEYGRFADLERYFGIKPSAAYELIGRGKIKSAVIKKKGARSGIRVINLESFANSSEVLSNADEHRASTVPGGEA